MFVFLCVAVPAQAFHEWVAACESRPSVRISSADRLPRSMAVQPFASTKRNDYLIEASVTQTAGARASEVEVRDRSRSSHQLSHCLLVCFLLLPSCQHCHVREQRP